MSATRGLAFAEEELRAVAGDRSFERGLRYVREVSGLEHAGEKVLATVRGAQDYLVVLTLPGGRVARPGMRGECGCPYGQEGFFCKHCVAVGLTVARAGAKVPSPRTERRAASGSAGSRGAGAGRSEPGRSGASADLSAWLGELNREDLLGLICDQLLEDEEWRERLELRAAAAAADLTAVRKRVAILLTPANLPDLGRENYGYLEGSEARRFGRRITEVSEAVGALIAAGHPEAAAVAAEQALEAVAEAARHANDPAGSVATAASELARRHLEACVASQRDQGPRDQGRRDQGPRDQGPRDQGPRDQGDGGEAGQGDCGEAGQGDDAGQLRLAEFLARRLASGDAVPAIRLPDYASALGPVGLEKLRELATAACERQSFAGPGRDALLEVLATAGDIDGLVRILAADPDEHGEAFLRIAAELDMAGRPAEALAWAERGLREVAKPDGELASYVADRYCEQDRTGDAERVLCNWFATDLSACGYRRLREQAELAGCWGSVRPWALEQLKAQARRAVAPGLARRQPAIVDALIDDGDIDAAWQEAKGLASDRQWLALADLAAPERPADALAVYRRQIESLRKRPCEVGYERLARLLESARDCCERLGKLAEFESYLRGVRADHKRRPRLIRVLDAHQL